MLRSILPGRSSADTADNQNKPAANLVLFLACLICIFSIYTLRQNVSGFSLKFLFCILVGGCLLALKKPLFHPIFWCVFLLFFISYLFRYFYYAGNHHFVSIYLCLAILLYTIPKVKQEGRLQFHTSFILFSALFFGAMHKLFSPEYTSGSYFQLQMELGNFLKPLNWFSSSWESSIQLNKTLYANWLSLDPGAGPNVILISPTPHITLLAKALSWSAIVLEALSGILILVKRNHLVSHLLLITTIIAVFVFTPETGFLSLLAAMGLLLAPNKSFRFIYVFLIAVFCLLMATGIGLR